VSTYTPIASQTLSSAAASVTFSGIPQTYTDLVVVVNATNSSGGDNAVALRFNGDTGSNYSMTRISGDGTSASSERNSNSTLMYLGLSNSTVYNSDIYHIMNYSNTTTNKTVLGRGNVANSRVRASVGLWRNTAAITSVTVINDASVNFASGSTFNLYGIASGGPKAFGGDTVTTDGTYYYHTFRSSGLFTPTQALSNVDYLVVAGGGGGGSTQQYGGGGGAGGYRTSIGGSALSLTAQAYTVTVGAGGASNNKGSNSVFSSITSTGGGLGGNSTNAGTGGTSFRGGTGGSGGGSGNANLSGGTGNEGGFSPVEGYAGGSVPSWPGNGAASGGGGAGGVGGNGGSNTAAGAGGDGVSNSISGTAVFYAGGGGGGNESASYAGGAGGNGGGGSGRGSGGAGSSGTANTGGGGGGGTTGHSGGSGIIVIRYSAA
jgi:hypothetical protein